MKLIVIHIMYSCKLCKKESSSKICYACIKSIEKDLTPFYGKKNISFAPLYSEVYFIVLAYKQFNLINLAILFANKIATLDLPKEYTITYIPCSKKRYKKNKYDHMQYIADIIAKNNKNIDSVQFFDRVSRKDQKSMNKYDRKNLSKFKLKDISISNKPIIIIDDIITTGYSMKECIRLLHNKFNNKIISISLIK